MPMSLSVTFQLPSPEWDKEFNRQFEQAQEKYPSLTLSSFVSWAVRYYLQEMKRGEREKEQDDEQE